MISKRYIEKKDLDELLGRLFGSSYFLEVGHQRILRPSSWADLKLRIGRRRELHIAGGKAVDRCCHLYPSSRLEHFENEAYHLQAEIDSVTVHQS